MAELKIAVKPKVWIGEQVAQAVRDAVAEYGKALHVISVEMGHGMGWANMAVKDRRLNGMVEILDYLSYDIEVRAVRRG